MRMNPFAARDWMRCMRVALTIWFLIGNAFTGAMAAEEEDDFSFEEFELAELTIRCRGCHQFSDSDLAKQSALAQRKHSRALKKGKFCVDCHEGTEVCCHAKQFTVKKIDPVSVEVRELVMPVLAQPEAEPQTAGPDSPDAAPPIPRRSLRR